VKMPSKRRQKHKGWHIDIFVLKKGGDIDD
jgi:hypothetical protein